MHLSSAVTLCTLSFTIQKLYHLAAVYLYVLCGSQNKRRVLPYTAFSIRLLQLRRQVFTARIARRV
jgi:hypothetical protein